MKEMFFISRRRIRRSVALLFILLFISLKLFSLVMCSAILILYLFRRKKTRETHIDRTDNSLFFAPMTGDLSLIKSEGHEEISIKSKMFRGFDILMPLKGEIIDYQESNIFQSSFPFSPLKQRKISFLIKSDEGEEIQLHLSRTGLLFHPQIWVKSGDRALLGATLGYLPFGGKLNIEINNNMNIVVTNKKNIESLVTLIASIRTDK